MLAILCGLSLTLGQVVPAMAAGVCATPARACCGCGGKLACCSEKSAPSSSAPATSVRAGSENQILSPGLTVVFMFLPTAGDSTLRSANNSSSPHSAAPIFARHCVRLI